jgi:hypothetical protein
MERPAHPASAPWIAGLLAAVLVLAGCSTPETPAATPTPPTSSVPAATTTVPAATTTAVTTSSPAGPTPPAGSSPVGPAAAPDLGSPAAPATAEPSTSSAATASEQVAEEPVPAQTPGFESTVSEIDAATAARMGSSWRPGCPVALADLRYLTVTYRGFDDADHTGELVVAASVAADVTDVFQQLYDAGFPIASLRLVDDFGGSDDDSMAADNSSAFNCRPVTGGGGFSEHSYGTAIDLNPVENPYLSGSLVLPPAGRQFTDRPDAPGVIQPGDAVVTAFASHGWTWGGTWSGPIDYQHFSASGR